MKRLFVLALLAVVTVHSGAICENNKNTLPVSTDAERKAMESISRMQPPRDYYIQVTSKAISLNGGISTVRLQVSPNIDRPQTEFSITEVDNLEFLGDKTWSASIRKGDTATFDLDVVLPERDTSGFKIVVHDDTNRQIALVYFLPDGDSLVFIPGDPKGLGVQAVRQTGRHSYGLTDEEFLKRKAEHQAQYDSTHPWDTTVAWYRDSSGEYILKPIDFSKHRPRNAQERKDFLEQSPLEDQELQEIVVDGKVFQRHRGETKFHEAPSVKDSQRIRDSIRAANPNPIYHIVIEFTSPEDSIFVSGLVDSLAPMDQPGVYHTEVRRDVLGRLEEAGIPYTQYRLFKSKSNPQSKDSLKP